MPRIGTGHTNLSTLLGLNAEGGQQMRQRVAGVVDEEAQKAQAGLDGAYNTWKGQAKAGGQGWEEWLSQNGGGGVEQGLNSATQARDAENTIAGRQALLQKTYRGGGSALDAMLMGGLTGPRGGAPTAGLKDKSEQAATHTAGLNAAAQAESAATRAQAERERQQRVASARAAPGKGRQANIDRRSNPFEP